MGLTIKKKEVAGKIDMQEGVEVDTPKVPKGTKPLAKLPEGAVMAGDENLVSAAKTATVTKQFPDGTMTETEEHLGMVHSAEAPAYVTVSMGLTKNMGDYNSLKFNVGITIPCAPTPEEIDQTYAEAKGWVEDKVNLINAEVEEQLGA